MCKNEEHCIRATLEAVAPYVTSIVVYDTGSTDETLAIVYAFFAEHEEIGGKVIQAEWEGFAVSKTKMMAAAKDLADYILHYDADDILLSFEPAEIDLSADYFMATLQRGGATWQATILYAGNLTWRFCGVAHTIIKCVERPNPVLGVLARCVLSAEEVGSRKFDPDKYLKDAKALEKQWEATRHEDPDGLNARSAFYAAQSYFDAQQWHDAKAWYEIYLHAPTWFEETYEAHVRIARCIRVPEAGVTGDWQTHLNHAVAIEPDRAEPYWLASIWYAQDRDMVASNAAAQRAAHKDLAAVKAKYKLFIDERAYTKPGPLRISSATPRVIVVDGFYADPQAARTLALSQTFVESPDYHKGRRTHERFASDEVRAEFERLLGKRITKWDYGTNGVFQICKAGDALVYHGDDQQYAAAVYLTPNAPLESGTSFFRDFATGARSLTDVPPPTFENGFYDATQFDLVDRIGNVFNRCVIWDAKLIHAASGYFGDTDETARLFQIFFFDAV